MVDWSMVGGCSMINRSSVYNRSMVSRSSMDSSILRDTIISDISNISSIIISMVTDTLSAAIRKSNRVGSFHITISISRFSSIVVSTRVVIMHSILVSVGGWHLLVHRGCMDYRGMVHRGSMIYRCSMVLRIG